MSTFRCPRCSLDVAGTDRFQVCKFCRFKGYFLPVERDGTVSVALEAPSRTMSAADEARLRKLRDAKAKGPTFVMMDHKPDAAELARDAPRKRKKRPRTGDGWLRNALLRLLADGSGKRGEGPGLWQLIPPAAMVAMFTAATALGTLLALAPHGGIAALRASEGRFALLTALNVLALGVGWFEWWRHRGERWGLFARLVGGAAAVLGGAYMLVVLFDLVLNGA